MAFIFRARDRCRYFGVVAAQVDVPPVLGNIAAANMSAVTKAVTLFRGPALAAFSIYQLRSHSHRAVRSG